MPVYDCELCNKTLRGSFKFHQHMIEHASRRLFICGYCNKSFLRQDDYELHTTNFHADTMETYFEDSSTNFAENSF